MFELASISEIPDSAILGKGQAEANVNIALIKYWGKSNSEENLPAVGSLSMTLNEWGSQTTVKWVDKRILNKHTFVINERLSHDLKVNRLLDTALIMAEKKGHSWAIQNKVSALVETKNSVPTASGLASSASGMAALGLASWMALSWDNPLEKEDLTEQVSRDKDELIDLVRIGSGSAVRSLYGGIVRLESDGRTMTSLCSATDWPLALIVCVVDPGPKAISSREGMERTRLTSPYYHAWVDSHAEDLDCAEAAVKNRDLSALGPLMEHSTFKMHAVMWSAKPPLRYIKGISLNVLDQVEKLRQDGVGVWATMDAGPHVKVLCHASDLEIAYQSLQKIPGLTHCLVRYPGKSARAFKVK